MSEEVSEEMQAAMALKLTENVRQLIREEIGLALQDTSFLYSLPMYNLSSAIASPLSSVPAFRQSVRQTVKDAMEGRIG